MSALMLATAAAIKVCPHMFALIDAISNEFVHGQPLKGDLKSRPPFESTI